MTPSTLDTLTEDQKDQLYDWLLEMPVAKVALKLAQPAPEGFGIKTHNTTLKRFKDRRWAEEAEAQIEAAKIASARSTDDATLDAAIASTLKRHLFARASSPDATTADLALLARFVHRNEKLKLEVERVQISRERLAQNNRRLDLVDRSVKVREETLAFRREESARRAAHSDNSKLKIKNSELAEQSDHLGPLATNWDEVGDRVCKHFGITRAELIRRAELRRTWKNPNDPRNAPAPAPHPQPDADHVAASSSCAEPAHEESSVPTSDGVTASVSSSADSSFDSNHECSSTQEPAPLRKTPVLETNNPTAGNPAPPLEALAAHNAQYFKALAAHAAAELNALNARTMHPKPENENQPTNH
jgi:hypothetical protein